MLMPELVKNNGQGVDKLLLLREELNAKAGGMEPEIVNEDKQTEVVSVHNTPEVSYSQNEKIIQFQQIIKNIVLDALQENNEDFQKEMGREVGDHVIKEMDYMMRMQDEREEERFKQIDETIRNFQKSRQQAAVTQKEEKRTALFRRKGKQTR